MKYWEYNARFYDKNQEVVLSRKVDGWTQNKLFGKNSQSFISFPKGTKAQIVDYLGHGGYQIKIGDNIINNVKRSCFEE